jgi:O-antigen ligase
MLLAFMTPLFQRYLSLVIALIIVNWLLELAFVKRISDIKNDSLRRNNLYFIIIYLLYAAGLLYTQNLKDGLFDLEVKLSLIIFPLIFATLPSELFEKKRINNLFISWIAGNFLATAFCVISAVSRYSTSLNINEFYYSRLSVLLHPGYFSMYLNFAIAILLYYIYTYRKALNLYKKVSIIVITLWFFIFIVLLSSKAGIISSAILFFCSVVYFFFYNRKTFSSIILLIIFAAVFFLSFMVFPRSYGRMKHAQNVIRYSENISNNTNDGTAERLLIWKSSLKIAKENFFTGLGTGDVKDGLITEYKKRGYSTAQERSLNAHNQYLQTFLSLGIIGFLVLILMIILPIIYSIKTGHYIYLMFLLIIGFNFMVESMLERQAGVIFYAFFNSFLFMIKKRP